MSRLFGAILANNLTCIRLEVSGSMEDGVASIEDNGVRRDDGQSTEYNGVIIEDSSTRTEEDNLSITEQEFSEESIPMQKKMILVWSK